MHLHNHSTKSPSRSPSLPSQSPSERPSISAVPSQAPSQAPSQPPSVSSAPTPCIIDEDFNVCFALDESGSIGAATYQSMKFFAAGVTEELQVKADASGVFFGSSIVEFGTFTVVSSPMSPSPVTLAAIPGLLYSGSLIENHAAAINECQSTFATFPGGMNFILLLTDGEPTRPLPNPQAAAITAATSAKGFGTIIHPIFDKNIPLPTTDPIHIFMSALSSYNEVDYVDFSQLQNFVGEIVADLCT